MSTGSVLDQMLAQLLAQSPMLVVYLIGLVMALAFWGRHPGPCLLTFLSMGLLLLTSVGVTYVQVEWVRGQALRGSAVTLGERLRLLAIVASFVRAGATGLLIWAVFSGRTSHATGGFPVGMPAVPRSQGMAAIPPPLGDRR